MEGGSPLPPLVPAHLSSPLITGRGTGTETCGIGGVFPPDDLLIGLDAYMNCILIYDLFWKVWLMGCATCLFVLTDGERDGLWWPVLSGHWLSCTGCYQYLLNMKWLMYWLPFLQLSTSLGCFLPRTFFLKKRIGLVSMDLIYITFTYYNQQECFRLSNWFSLWCLEPWMNHLPPVWLSKFRFMFLNESLCLSLTYWRGIFYWYLVFIIVFIHCPNVTFIIPLKRFYSKIAFFYSKY